MRAADDFEAIRARRLELALEADVSALVARQRADVEADLAAAQARLREAVMLPAGASPPWATPFHE